MLPKTRWSPIHSHYLHSLPISFLTELFSPNMSDIRILSPKTNHSLISISAMHEVRNPYNHVYQVSSINTKKCNQVGNSLPFVSIHSDKNKNFSRKSTKLPNRNITLAPINKKSLLCNTLEIK